jgi:hypothetical protein
MQLYYIHKFQYKLARYSYLLFLLLHVSAMKSDHHQGATSFLDVYSLRGNVLTLGVHTDNLILIWQLNLYSRQ